MFHGQKCVTFQHGYFANADLTLTANYFLMTLRKCLTLADRILDLKKVLGKPRSALLVAGGPKCLKSESPPGDLRAR